MLKLAKILLLNLIVPSLAYVVPEARFEIFSPRGFSVSIPEDGNHLFAFHGNLNKEFIALEAGTWSADIVKVVNGRFTYRNYEAIINIGDVINYWTYVIRDNNLGYRYDNGEFEVKEFSEQEDIKSSALPIPNAHRPTSNHNTSPSCSIKSKTSVNDISLSCPGDVIFEEHFNGKSLNPGKWRMERRIPQAPDFEFNIYLDNTESISLNNGTALLKPIIFEDVYGKNALSDGLDLKFDCTGELNTTECHREADSVLPPLITSQFSTINSFKFRYGRVEVRAKLPSADWVFPQIFLNPVESKYGKNNYSSGQMRVIQSDGNCQLRSGVILNDKEPFRSLKMCKNRCARNGDWHSQFHNFTMIWLPESIEFLVDGKVFCVVGADIHSTLTDGRELPNKNILKQGDTSLAPFDVNFYITLGYGVGGVNDFADAGHKPKRNEDENNVNRFWGNAKNYDWTDEKYQFEIDYIKVYSI